MFNKNRAIIRQDDTSQQVSEPNTGRILCQQALVRLSKAKATDTKNGDMSVYKNLSIRLKDINGFSNIADFINEITDQNTFQHTCLLNQLITKFKGLHALHEARIVYNVAINNKLADTITYNSFIDAIANNRSGDSQAAALYVLKMAQDTNKANSITYATTIKAISKSSNPDVAKAIHLYDMAFASFLPNDAHLYNYTIEAIAKSYNPNIEKAINILQAAKNTGYANETTYGAVLDAMAKNKNPPVNKALTLFNEAQEAGFVNEILFNNVIDVVAKSNKPNVAVAIRLLELAKKAGYFNASIYNSTLNTIARSEKPDASAALELFEEAKFLGIADIITYNNALDVFAKCENPDYEHASHILCEAEQKKLITFPELNLNKPIDLHTLSFGMTYFWIKKLFANLPVHQGQTQISLIYGRGLHCKFNKGDHDVKRAVEKAVSELGPELINYQVDAENEGVVQITINPRKANNIRGFRTNSITPTNTQQSTGKRFFRPLLKDLNNSENNFVTNNNHPF